MRSVGVFRVAEIGWKKSSMACAAGPAGTGVAMLVTRGTPRQMHVYRVCAVLHASKASNHQHKHHDGGPSGVSSMALAL